MIHYQRTMQVNLFKHSSELVDATASLVIGSPTINQSYEYQLSVSMKLNEEKMVIQSASVEKLSAEAAACDGTKELAKQLVGVRLDDKYLWKVSRIFGRSDGCQHLYELAIEIARAYSNLQVGEYLQVFKEFDRDNPPVNLSMHCAGLSFLGSQPGSPN